MGEAILLSYKQLKLNIMTPEEIERAAQSAAAIVKAGAKDIGSTEIVNSIDGVTSIPVINKSGKVVRVPIDIMGVKTVDFSQLNSLNKPESCGRYMVEEKNTGVIIGVLDIVIPWSRSSVLQRFTTSVQLSSLNAGDAIPTMEYNNLYTYDRFFNNSSSVLEGVNKGEWSKWKEAYDLNNFAKSVKWSGEIVNGITVSPNSYTGDDGTVVLVGNYTFAYKVISGGNTIYYGNWHGREDYQKNIYQSGTIGWKAGFYDYLLYVSPTSVWMKKSDSELVNISSEGSGGGSDALLLGDINSLTDNSASSQIATALNNKTLAELQDAVRNGASIQFVGDYGVVDIIHKDQSSGQLVFGFIYTDEPVYAPYMSKIIALEYTNGNWTCKVREDVNLSSGGSGGGSGIMVVNDLGALKTSSTDAEIKDILSPYTFDDILAGMKNGKLLVGVNKDSGWASVYQCPQWTEELIILVSNNLVLKAVGIHKEPDGSLEVATAEEDIPMLSSQIANSLTTIDDGYVLDARQGKVLADRIAALEVAVAALQNK